MARARTLVLAAAAAALVAIARLSHGRSLGHVVPGGTVMGHTGAYDRMSRLLLRGLYRSVAADVAIAVPAGGRVLEVGSGPGHLAVDLAAEHDLDVTGIDLDPDMVRRASANASGRTTGGRRPTFVTADVAGLPFPDASFDAVVSTMSMHHWADPNAGLTEIARVLRPEGRALIWDFRGGRSLPLHQPMPDPADRLHDAPLRIVRSMPWRWPLWFHLIQRLELEPVATAGTAPAPHD